MTRLMPTRIGLMRYAPPLENQRRHHIVNRGGLKRRTVGKAVQDMPGLHRGEMIAHAGLEFTPQQRQSFRAPQAMSYRVIHRNAARAAAVAIEQLDGVSDKALGRIVVVAREIA